MAKRITISIPDELFEQIQKVKNEYGEKLNSSQICQEALLEAVKRAEAHKIHEEAGYQDGLESFSKLTRKTTERIAYALNGDNPRYKGRSRYEVVSDLEDRNHGDDQKFFTPRFKDILDGMMVLHDWLKYGELEDKRYSVGWSYVEGWYLGIKDAFFKQQEG